MRSMLFALIATMLLAGCAGAFRKPYIARGVSQADAAAVAVEIAAYMGQLYPPARTTIAIELPRFARWRDPVAPVLAESLRRGGFAVLETDTGVVVPPAAKRLGYSVSAWPDGLLVQIQLQGTVASRWYARGVNGGLVGVSPFAVKEAAYGQ
ncbi:hypothetical protein [uncultured Stenotrophomonas sp.]|uniref:hypothetical protein n=1 Tax=uncultured Stenotrophomonas sp. TaxID=165438 RepID=UPI0025D1DEB0|nr:hypothetical protein [uncultured Stenotrophomonas sp.]